MVFLPPRHGKSTLIGQYTPVWWLMHRPNDTIIFTAYEGGFAMQWGASARDLIVNEDWLGLKVDPDNSSKSYWKLKGFKGGMHSIGIGGALTGKGADLLIIDDIIKNPVQALSKHVRDMHWDWYRAVARTRLNSGGKIIICFTRWHEDDLAGRILKESQEDWTVLALPAVAEKDEYFDNQLFRKTGEALWPEKYDINALLKTKNTIHSFWWNALYQQNPTPLEGSLFKREHFKYYQEAEREYLLGGGKVAPKNLNVFFTVDLASSLKEGSSYFCLGVFGITPQNDLLVLEIYRDRIEGPEQGNIVKNYYIKYKPMFISIESTAYQLTFVQILKKEGLPVRGFTAKGDKKGRAMTAATHYQQGRIFHPANAPWLEDFENELLFFPQSENDDQVDVMSMASIELFLYKTYNKRTRFVREEKDIIGGLNE
jgi:predicted phage terminase large subunit-like protein